MFRLNNIYIAGFSLGNMERESNFARRGRTKTRCTPFANAQGQVTIFIILAVVIVGGVIAYGDFGNYFSGDGRASFINVIFAGQGQKEGNPQ